MPKQMLPGMKKKAAPKPKNMGGKMPAKLGSPKTNHGKMAFRKGGKVCY